MRTKPLLLSLLLSVLVGLGTGLAAEGQTTWGPGQNLSLLAGRSTQTTMARDPTTGDLFVAWVDDGLAPREEILARRWKRAFNRWLPLLNWPAENLSNSEWQDGGPLLFFDEQGQGLLLWTRRYAVTQGAPENGTDLLWRAWDGTAWSPEAVLLHEETYLPSSYGYGLIPVPDADGLSLFIVRENSYRTARYENGAWNPPTSWTYLGFDLAQLLLDEQGLLHAAAFGPNNRQSGFDGWFKDAYYLTYDGQTWSEAVNLSFSDGVADGVQIAFDEFGWLHFLWLDSDSPYSSQSLKSAIWERVLIFGSWTPNAEVTAYNAGQGLDSFALAADVDGTLHLAWSEGLVVDNALTDLDIYYQAGHGLDWGPEEKVLTSAAASRNPTIAVHPPDAFLVWEEIFAAGGTLPDREVYCSLQTGDLPPLQTTYLPLVFSGAGTP